MVITEIDDLEILDEIEESVRTADPMKYGDCYWRRSDGWITHAHADEHNIRTYKDKGMTPLEQYGKFFLTPILRRDKFNRLIATQDTFNRPWAVILQKGGAHQFPLDQVIAHNWHRNCSYIWYEELPDKLFNKHTVTLVRNGRRYRDPATGQRAFPQLDGFVSQDFICRSCGNVYNYEEHLNAHRLISHKEDVQIEVTRQTVQIISDGLSNRAGPGDNQLAIAISQLAAILADISKRQDAIEAKLAPVAVMVVEPVDELPDEESTLEEVEQVAESDIVDDPAKNTVDEGWDIPPGAPVSRG